MSPAVAEPDLELFDETQFASDIICEVRPENGPPCERKAVFRVTAYCAAEHKTMNGFVCEYHAHVLNIFSKRTNATCDTCGNTVTVRITPLQ